MPIQCLIRANEMQVRKGILKGMVEVIKEEPCVWGKKECLPDYVILRIPDATKDQASNFLMSWKNTFEYSVTNVNDGKQITLSIDPRIIGVLGSGKALKSELRNFLVDRWNATIVSYNQYSVTFIVPSETNLQKMRNQFKDFWEEKIAFRIYMFSEQDVNWAISSGGFAEISRVQALQRIIDRRDS